MDPDNQNCCLCVCVHTFAAVCCLCLDDTELIHSEKHTHTLEYLNVLTGSGLRMDRTPDDPSEGWTTDGPWRTFPAQQHTQLHFNWQINFSTTCRFPYENAVIIMSLLKSQIKDKGYNPYKLWSALPSWNWCQYFASIVFNTSVNIKHFMQKSFLWGQK